MGLLCTVEKWAENLDEVTLSRWLVAEGARLKFGEPVCEIITDKVTFEYVADIPGLLLRQYCGENSVLPVGYAFGFIGEAEEALPEGVEERNRALLQEHQAKAALVLDLDEVFGGTAAGTEKAGARVRATPAARRVARETGVTVEEVAAAMGGEGVVTEEDVERFVAARSGNGSSAGGTP